MKIKIFFIVMLFNSFIFSQQLSKVYVLGEGGFSPGTAKLSMLDKTNNSYTENIFSPFNLGLFPDGLLLYENHLYIVEQGNYGGSGKIYKADTNGTVLKSAIFGTNPYSLAITNGKIYVTNGSGGYVSVLKLEDLSEIKTIPVGVFPQEILAYGSYIFVANTSLYGGSSDSTVSVINTKNDSVVHTITVKKDPYSLVISNDNHLLISCPGDAATGRIFKVNPTSFSIVSEYSIPTYGIEKEINVDRNSSALYFISFNNSIVKFDPENNTATEIIPSVFLTNFYYGYKFEPTERKHYVLDAKSFVVTGSLNVHSENGTLENSYAASQIPRRVIFKYTEQLSGTGKEETPNSFFLSQNYPNPFNPSTRISFSLENRGLITLKIYDILGNEITQLLEGEFHTGKHSAVFNADGLASGVYYYTLTTGAGSNTKKMILQK